MLLILTSNSKGKKESRCNNKCKSNSKNSSKSQSNSKDMSRRSKGNSNRKDMNRSMSNSNKSNSSAAAEVNEGCCQSAQPLLRLTAHYRAPLLHEPRERGRV
ncbi:hypothetical protein FHG87_011221 [Trinorchestia longiramus]|nr:hypothetical protein FHG87_011221 [Trinorchestia longiramus]